MALDNAALLEVLEAMQAAGVEDRSGPRYRRSIKR